MYRIKSQLCEVFNCTNPELTSKGILVKFMAWLQQHPEVGVCHNIEYGERINGDIADKFFAFYKGELNFDFLN